MKQQAKLVRNATSLFNFLLKKQQNDKRIGEMTLRDFFEICVFLSELETKNTHDSHYKHNANIFSH